MLCLSCHEHIVVRAWSRFNRRGPGPLGDYVLASGDLDNVRGEWIKVHFDVDVFVERQWPIKGDGVETCLMCGVSLALVGAAMIP